MSRRRVARGDKLTVIQGEGRRFSYLKQAFAFHAIMALVAVLVLLLAYHWLGAQLLAFRLQIVTVEPGHMETSIETEGVVARGERVIHAPCSGIIVEALPSGERVAAGTDLVTIVALSRDDLQAMQEHPAEPATGTLDRLKGIVRGWFNLVDEADGAGNPVVVTGEIPPWFREKVTVSSNSAGLLSYHLDGWEMLDGHVFPGRELFEEPLPAPIPLVEGTFVESGQPLLKIVNNWAWYFHVMLPLDPGRNVAAQQKVFINFHFAPDSPVEAVLEKAVIDAAAGRVRLTYRLERQLDGFAEARTAGGLLSYHRREGILLPAKALVETEGGTGVMINRGGTVFFAPVNVIRSHEDQVLVDGIEPYTMVISRPELVREGQRLN